MVYMPYWAYTPWTLSFLVRSSQPSNALIPEVRRAVWAIDPQVAIPSLKSMDEQLNDSVSTERFQVVVLTSFGAAALLLAVLGVYGVMAYSVSMRHQEFGVRIALGSGKTALVRLVMRQAAYPVLLVRAWGSRLRLWCCAGCAACCTRRRCLIHGRLAAACCCFECGGGGSGSSGETRGIDGSDAGAAGGLGDIS